MAINDPVPWSRKRPDGYELKWLLSLATGSHRGVAPFLIEDVTPRRRAHSAAVRSCRIGVTGIDKVTVAVGELAQIEKWYGALLGVTGEPFADATLGADGLRFKPARISWNFVSPRERRSPLVTWLREFGPSPYSAVLESAAQRKDSSSAASPMAPITGR